MGHPCAHETQSVATIVRTHHAAAVQTELKAQVAAVVHAGLVFVTAAQALLPAFLCALRARDGGFTAA